MSQTSNQNYLCAFCDGKTETKFISRTFNRNGKEFIFHNIETQICRKCGEAYYDRTSFLRVDDKPSTRLQEQLERRRNELSELLEKNREADLVKARKKKKYVPKGRPKIKAELIEKARKLVETRTLADAALSLGISTRTLYNKGISRKAIVKENALKANGYD